MRDFNLFLVSSLLLQHSILLIGVEFAKFMKQQFKQLGLSNTYLDENGPIIYNRAKYYIRFVPSSFRRFDSSS